jgi:uncharacterized repeat protein (TIGR03803 family)
MKTYIINLFLLPLLIAGLGLIPASRVTAQTFTTLHSFTATTSDYPYINSDGAYPFAGLILSGNTLYGTAHGGGSLGWGTVFAVHTDGTGFTTLHNFTGGDDGYGPRAGLILSSNTLYGTAAEGGSPGDGTVFAVHTDGTGFTTLHNFTGGSDGFLPVAGLILSGNTLYGTAANGGRGYGTVFAVNTDGTGFTTLYTFTGGYDGWSPKAVILSGNTLYGTAGCNSVYGTAIGGTVFAVNTDGTGFMNVYNFTPLYNSTNSDGAGLQAGLILSSNTLYGTAVQGGSSAGGTVFKVNTDGTGFTNLHSFTAASGPLGTNSDGANPFAGLILSNNTLYGTTSYGGSLGDGTVFAVNIDSTGFTNLHSFTQLSVPDTGTNSDGGNPIAGLILSGNTLYGTAEQGGSSDNGTVFSLSLGSASAPVPTLTIVPSGTNVILTWPANAAGFALQSTTNLVSPVIWTNVSPAPVVVNGQYAVTNPASGTKKFYQLSQ